MVELVESGEVAMNRLFKKAGLIGLAICGSFNAHANVGEAYGFGSRTAGMAGASVAGGFEAFSPAINPAGLSLDRKHPLQISWALISMTPSFTPIQDIIIENETISDEVNRGSVDQDYRSTLGQAVGFSYLALPEWMNLSIGGSGFIPIEQFAYVDTGEVFIPEYVLYRARTQRPQFNLAASIMPAPGLHLGVGMHIGFSLTGRANVFLQTDSEKPSTMRFSSSLAPKSSPYFGILFAPGHKGDWSAEPSSKIAIGAVVRMPLNSNAEILLSSGARVFGSFAGVDFNFASQSVLYYDPLSIEMGVQLKPWEGWTTHLQVDYQAWKGFTPPSLSIEEPNANCSYETDTACGINISGSNNPDLELQNIFIPRIAQEIQLTPAWSMRAGYARNPGIFDPSPENYSGAGNTLDPPKDIYSFGVSHHFRSFLGHQIPGRLDFHASAHLLETQTITKTPGDELGEGTGDLKIGAPGYQAGGKILGGGVSLSLAF